MLNSGLVFLGGGLGSVCRYALGEWLNVQFFPYNTLISNVLACFVLGVLLGIQQREGMSQTYVLLVGTGFCGGFSTFSTFSKELLIWLQQGQWLWAMGYLCLSVVLGIGAVYLGIKCVNY